MLQVAVVHGDAGDEQIVRQVTAVEVREGRLGERPVDLDHAVAAEVEQHDGIAIGACDRAVRRRARRW